MRNPNIKFMIAAAVLAGSIGTFSVFAQEGESSGMMSSEGMKGMDGMKGMQDMMPMMNMMADMSPEDRQAMTETCMNMMQNAGSHGMSDSDNTK